MIVNLVHKLNEDPAHINMVNETVLFLSQIKTKQRYVWTKREFTEEGRALGELVDQVSLLTVGLFDFSSSAYLFVFTGDVVYLALQDIFISLWYFSIRYLFFSFWATNFPHWGH